jgi:hypothetical protein
MSTPGQPSPLRDPDAVVLPAGQTSVSFPTTVIDNTLLDGPELISITASADGYFPAARTSPYTTTRRRR